MSVKLMSRVWETIDLSGSDLTLALALADIANDQGDNIRPGVSYLAWKTNVSERTVQVIIDKGKKSGALSIVAEWNIRSEERRSLPSGGFRGGRGILPIYRLDLSKFPTKKTWEECRGFAAKPKKGEESAPFEPGRKGAVCDTKGCSLQQERVQKDPAHIRKNTVR